MKTHLYTFLSAVTFLTCTANAEEIAGKFAPPAGKVLVFTGQDNASVGGTENYVDGYVDNVGVPAGITHYVYFAEGWTNDFGHTFPKGKVAGLRDQTEWASGPMHQQAYLDSPTLDRCIMHVSIAMEGNCEDKVADGSFDHLIADFVDFVESHPEHPFLIRIGYEFDGSWNQYDPANFKKAFRRIVDALRAKKLNNFAIVFASSSSVKPGQFEEYDPGTEYYDWIGYSWWGGVKDALPALEYARKVHKPVFIAEATPRGHFFDQEDHQQLWEGWFTDFFNHIETNQDVVRAVSYINADWDSQKMWDDWGQTRIETAPYIKQRWLEMMARPQFINGIDNPFVQIGFTPSGTNASTKSMSTANASSRTGPPVAVRPPSPYLNALLPIEERVDDLIARMSLDEKIAQITGWWDPSEERLRDQGDIFRPDFYGEKCPDGIGELGPLHNLNIDQDARQYAAVQEYFRNRTRLGIPAILHDEAAHGFMKFEANSFPTPIGLSCTWNPDLMVAIYSQAGQEARSRGVSHVLSPVVDVARDLRWGRVDETLGEDPFLASRLGAAMVRGLQGSSDGTIAPTHVAATLKHFAGYAGTVGGRNRSPYPNGPRHLLDTEVAPFRYIIETAKPAAVMAAFNEVDGVPCHVNPWMLTEVLRQRLGFQGLIVGDYQGIDLVRRYQNIGNSDADAGRMALEAGLQLELPNNFGFKHLAKLVDEGKVNLSTIDAAVRAVLELKFRLGLFESPAKLDVAKAKSLANSAEAIELTREAARQSIVLLKNEGNLLPLTPGDHPTVAVIGPNADVCRLGNYSGRPLKTVSLLEGIRNHLGERAKVVHAEGCMIAKNDAKDSYANWRYVNEIEFASVEDNRALIAQAVEVASQSDLIILALGENVLLGREAWSDNHVGDRTTFDLTDSQQILARQLLAIGKPVVLVLNNSKPVTLNELGDQIPAILTLHYAGQQTGTAAAEILFGQSNPSGKLTISWPRSVGHLPAHYSQHGSAQIFDYVDSPRSPVYPFGHGLSYTTFEYGSPSLSASEIHPGGSVSVNFSVTNTGERRGTEIAQAYVSGQSFAIARPQLELKGFQRVTLNAGETKQIAITLNADDLYFHNPSLERVLPVGKYLVRVGGSSTALSQPLTLTTKSTSETTLPHSGVPHSGVPHSGVPHSGVPHSGVPHSGVPHSGVPHSGVPHSGVPHSEIPNSGVPQAAAPNSNLPMQLEATSRPKASPNSPNVLFIAIDDLRPELASYGAATITPNLDRLAKSGIQFDRAYCQQAVCGASRLSIMGGLYPTFTGEQTFHVSGWRDRYPNLLTMNQHFGNQGYETIGLGKIYHGHSGPGVDTPNWNRWIDLNADTYAKPENIEALRKALAEGKVGNAQDPPKGPLTESADVHDDTYLDGQRAAKAVEVLQDLAQQKGKPFFLAVGLAKPHLPFVAPQKYWDLYQREDFKMPSNREIPPGYPPYAANLMAHEMHKYSDFEGESPADFSDELNHRLLHGYAAATSYADACLGRILDALEQTGLAKNTIVVLWGDHGYKLGDHSTWVKHTNFECDTRVPLIVRDPRLPGNQSTRRLVELIDLYPTLCDLTGIPTPVHCQGRSFRKLLDDPSAGHRLDSYSSYPAGNLVGHSIRFLDYRYTEWRDAEGKLKTRVLTDLKADPGEVTNVVDDPKHAEALARGVERLEYRITLSKTEKKTPAKPQVSPPARTGLTSGVNVSSEQGTISKAEMRGTTSKIGKTNTVTLNIDAGPTNLRQTIDGFGGSIAFWGTQADNQALQIAIEELEVSILRAQGEVAKNGRVDYNKDILQRAMKLNPELNVLQTFWQPRSAKQPEIDDWLDVQTLNGQEQYVLKPAMRDAWAEELVDRVRQYRDWGINVTTVGVQNEANWSHPGTQTCRWNPEELREFIQQDVKPRLRAANLGNLAIAAPDLAYIGPNASEIARYLPTITSEAVDVAAYHMYDSFTDGNPGSIDLLIDQTKILGKLRREHFPDKRLWMTETTGAQWNGQQWHTYGWNPNLTEHDKAIKAARYIHMTLVDAEANAFLWWGLLYSLAPERITDPNTRQKHRDEGLVLVDENNSNGFQAFLERTKKFYTFRQYSAFVRPGYQRIAIKSPEGLQVSAFRSPDGEKIVIVTVNDTETPTALQITPPSGLSSASAWQTDRQRDCEPVNPNDLLAPMSVRTTVFQ
ncbi:MAG: sulfatase-like hydrolase/transferase [Planctomycetaceae bacterium]|nr:sulfatase-like hydrolase/transferase [Planctomycetaceae bacterium]